MFYVVEDTDLKQEFFSQQISYAHLNLEGIIVVSFFF